MPRHVGRGREDIRSRIKPTSPNEEFIDYRKLPNGPVLPPYTDISTISGLETYEDTMAVLNGALAETTFQGRDYANPSGPNLSGWRGGIVRDMTGMTSNSGIAITTWIANPARVESQGAGGPLGSFVSGDTGHGIGAWVQTFIFWAELGLVGRAPENFKYIDTTFLPTGIFGNLDEIALTLFMKGNKAWTFINDIHVNGPVSVPAGLQASIQHGANIDAGSSTLPSKLYQMRMVPYNGPVIADVPAPVLTKGTMTKSTSSLSVAIPDGSAIGDRLLLLVAGASAPTVPSEWGAVSVLSLTSGIQLRAYEITVTGRESFYGLTGQNVAVSHLAGAYGACVIKIAKANTARLGVTANSAQASSSTSHTTATNSVFGPHRLSLIALAAPANVTVTFPVGWTVTQTSGADAVTLAISTVDDWSSPPGALTLTSTTNQYGGNPDTVPTQAVTLSSATTSCAFHYVINPDPINAPL